MITTGELEQQRAGPIHYLVLATSNDRHVTVENFLGGFFLQKVSRNLLRPNWLR